MGMVSLDVKSDRFKPRYTTTTKKFYDFARNYIFRTNCLDVLHFAGDCRVLTRCETEKAHLFRTDTPANQICSWAPDWSIPERPVPLDFQIEKHNTAGICGSCCKAYYSFDSTTQSLRVRACLMNKVKRISIPLYGGIHPLINNNTIFQLWFKIANKTFPKAKHSEERFDSMLIMRELSERSQEPLSPSDLAEYTFWISRNGHLESSAM